MICTTGLLARAAAGGEAWDSWYRDKVAEILALLKSPATRHFAGEIEDLDRLLQPIGQDADIGALVDGFVGRIWLQDRLDVWRRTALHSRLFWLTGAPGAGKSAFAAWIAHQGRANVLGANLCRYNVEDRRDPGRVLRTVAFQIASRLPDYRRLLLERLLRLDPDGTELARKSPAALFEWLLVEPLRYGIDGGRRDDRYLIVIDALDETIRDGRSELAEVLAEAIMKLPVWIAMVVTSRPEPLILRQFAGFQRQQIDAQSAENLDDLRSFAHEWLGGLAHKPGEVDLLVEAVVAASSGNFLYLRKLREAVAVGVVELASLQALPQGLVGLYERWFRRQFPDEVAYEAIVPLLEVLVAAQQPVPEAWLARLFRWPKRKRSRALEALGSLFEWRAEGIAAFHKSLRDWLVDDHVAGPDFVIDASRGTTRLVRGLWEEFLGWAKAKNRSSLDLFCIRELPSQVMLASAEEVRALPVSREAWPELWGALVLAADQLTTAFNWEAALSWWRMVVTLSEVPGDIARAQRSLAYRSAGDVLRTLGRRLEAGDAYRTALQIAQALVAEDAENFEWRRALFSAQIRIGNIHAVAGGSADALAAYREANNLIRALAGQHRGDSELQRDLFVSLERLGDALWTQGDNAGALAAYQEGSCSGIAPETRQ